MSIIEDRRVPGWRPTGSPAALLLVERMCQVGR